MTEIKKVLTTEASEGLIDKIRARHGELMFHMSGGCCDGSQPMCFEAGEFRTGDSDVCLGSVHGCLFWISRDQYEYLKHTELTLDAVTGRGSSFSLEIPMGYRFIIRSRIFTDEEYARLDNQE